ncbi:MAG: hypothetical protein JW706_09645 [Opitutales bacterium]|nr:hypothetical protein [Opitutales bacterium]
MKTENMDHGELSPKDLDLLSCVAWGSAGWVQRWKCRRLIRSNPGAARLLSDYRTMAQGVRETVNGCSCPDAVVNRLSGLAPVARETGKDALLWVSWSRMAPVAALGLCVLGAGLWWNYGQQLNRDQEVAEAALLARQSIVMVSGILGRPSVDACELAVKQSTAGQMHGTMFEGVNTIKERLAYENE